MAPIFKTCAVAAALAGLCSAAPVDKRDYAYDVVTDVTWVTVTDTITVNPIAATGVSATVQTHPTTYVTTTHLPPPPPPAATSTSELPPPPPPSPATSSSSSASSSTAPQATSPSTSSGGSSPIGICTSGSPCSGDGTYYDTATSLSAPSYCDTANDGTSENVLALSLDIMTEELCGKTVTASYGGKTITGTVVDKCMGCAKESIDMSRHMFGELDDLSAGRITVDWWFS